ncbi:hypothetical protein BHY_0388 [Borrelia nietonii YOR]|uniref:Undecaprenyl-diphosphate phosphatase n=1 Tax=Borrelia nietonii YOR TaxID=1293576 RepID=A0ABM5PGW0_9SPIR|nr:MULTISPECIES: hypothetical protein [Borrelia]AHH03339.1 hypothetical protein BHY_0388 [Borrelia nietonii YOR]UPA09070.1 hypothetical protein bhYOR_000353 [Borrelia nietonii YOR]
MMNAIMNLIEELFTIIVFSASPYNADNINVLAIVCKMRTRPIIILFVFGLFVFNIILKYYIMKIKSSFIYVGIIQ